MKKLLFLLLTLISNIGYSQSLITTGPPRLRIMSGYFNPNNSVIGYVGEMYLENNNQTGVLWQKVTGSNNATGWLQLINSSTVPTFSIDTNAYVASKHWVDSVALALSVNSWNTTGNAGTNPSVNFIGTTDAEPLLFKTKNTTRIFIDTTGQVGIGTTTFPAPISYITEYVKGGFLFGDYDGGQYFTGNYAQGIMSVGYPSISLNASDQNANAQLFALDTNTGNDGGFKSYAFDSLQHFLTLMQSNNPAAHKYYGFEVSEFRNMGDFYFNDGTNDRLRFDFGRIGCYYYTRNTVSDTLFILDTLGNAFFQGQLTIQGGAPGIGKVLTSDANGLASWQAPGKIPHIIIPISSNESDTLIVNYYNILDSSAASTNDTIVFPLNPNDGDFVEVKVTSQLITSHVNGNGKTVKGLITLNSQGIYTKWIYDASNNTWY